MVSICAGIGNVADLHRRQGPILFGTELDCNLHRVPADSGSKFFRASKLPFDRTPGLQHGKHAEVFS